MKERTAAGHCACPKAFSESIRHLPEDFAVAISVPPVTPSLEPVFAQLLQHVAHRPEIELSLNDWGTLYRCAQMKKQGSLSVSLTAGVLLSGQDTDPILQTFLQGGPGRTVQMPEGAVRLAWAPPPDALVKHWRTPSVFWILPFLEKLGVSRIELCNQPCPFPDEEPGLPVTLFRETIISVFPCTRNCSACAAEADMIRNRKGTVIVSAQNLILAEMPLQEPPWADRVLMLQEIWQDYE